MSTNGYEVLSTGAKLRMNGFVCKDYIGQIPMLSEHIEGLKNVLRRVSGSHASEFARSTKPARLIVQSSGT